MVVWAAFGGINILQVLKSLSFYFSSKSIACCWVRMGTSYLRKVRGPLLSPLSPVLLYNSSSIHHPSTLCTHSQGYWQSRCETFMSSDMGFGRGGRERKVPNLGPSSTVRNHRSAQFMLMNWLCTVHDLTQDCLLTALRREQDITYCVEQNSPLSWLTTRSLRRDPLTFSLHLLRASHRW